MPKNLYPLEITQYNALSDNIYYVKLYYVIVIYLNLRYIAEIQAYSTYETH